MNAVVKMNGAFLEPQEVKETTKFFKKYSVEIGTVVFTVVGCIIVALANYF